MKEYFTLYRWHLTSYLSQVTFITSCQDWWPCILLAYLCLLLFYQTKFPFFKAQNCCTSKTADWRSRTKHQSRFYNFIAFYLSFCHPLFGLSILISLSAFRGSVVDCVWQIHWVKDRGAAWRSRSITLLKCCFDKAIDLNCGVEHGTRLWLRICQQYGAVTPILLPFRGVLNTKCLWLFQRFLKIK